MERYHPRPGRYSQTVLASVDWVPTSVLVIDDDPAVGAVLVRRLEEAGHKALWLPEVATAISRVQAADFDLLFCDLMMADVDGEPWHEYLTRVWPDSEERLVVMTGGAFSPLAREFAIQNVDRLVEKPFDIAAEVARRMRQRRQHLGTSKR